MRKLIRAIIAWAYEDPPTEVLHTTELGPVVFCRARPGLPDRPAEHIHQYPYTIADGERYRGLGWMVSATDCLLPGEEYEGVDGDPALEPVQVIDRIT